MAHWFKHDNTALTDQKILGLRFKFGMEGYGIFWAIMETMHQDSTGYINREAIGGLSIAYGVDNNKLNEIVDFCLKTGLLLECEHGNIYNKRMQIQKSELADYSLQGRKGAEIRWKNRGAIGGANSGGNAGANADKIRLDKIRLEKSIIIPESLNVPTFISSWENWKLHRKQIKKPLTDKSSEMLLKRFESVGVDTAIKMIHQSIENGWQGIFEIKPNGQHIKPKLEFEKVAPSKYANVKMEVYNVN